jgi:hypothetical protein
MSTTVRIVAGIVVAAFLLGIAVLEVMSQRVRVEPAFPEPAPAYVAETEIREEPGVDVPVEVRKETREVQQFVVLQDHPTGGR